MLELLSRYVAWAISHQGECKKIKYCRGIIQSVIGCLQHFLTIFLAKRFEAGNIDQLSACFKI
uniref:Uncharacterized protein n=1 Tax=Yersinia enterocolitica W22703 TaxID=913028 RepID=F4MXP9_YEREN|nr:unknown protein [Yersinia enterocolitica W22703]